MNRIIFYLSLIGLWFFTSNQLHSQSNRLDTLLQIGLGLQQAYELDEYQDQYIFDRCEKAFLDLLELEPDNKKALYSLGVLYYNDAANALERIRNDENLKDAEKEALKERAKKMLEMYDPISHRLNSLE